MHARRALQIDPLNDELNANIFNWLVHSGQRSKAVEHCQVMCQTYKREGTPLPDNLARLCETARVMATQNHTAPADPGRARGQRWSVSQPPGSHADPLNRLFSAAAGCCWKAKPGWVKPA